MSENSELLSTQLANLVSEAEKATSNVADPELRRVAFDRILEHLLQNSSHAAETHPPKKAKAIEAKEKVQKGSTKPGPKIWIQELAEEGFFGTPRTSIAIRQALDERGHILKPQDLTGPLDRLVNEKILRRKKMPAEEGAKPQVHWYNW